MGSGESTDTVLTEAGRRIFADIEAELRAFERDERRRLGLDDKPKQWWDPNPQHFTKDQRAQTTVLFGGLTRMHDAFIEAGLSALGYRAKALECPDNEALQYGKEFGNRAQCNPTYFTVGNLLKYLTRLRGVEGMSVEDIVGTHLFVTFGACGPCRFGSYVTEYRKALRDSGFDGFRVIPIQKDRLHEGLPGEAGLDLDARFFIMLFKCLMAGDVLNVMGYRTRPYEVTPGATDAALEVSKAIVSHAIADGRSVLRALRRCRKVLAKVEVNRLQPKPKVAVIGEFWDMTTEGDGNYRLQRFLEAEGAECDIQLVTNWALYEFWGRRYDIRTRMMLRRREDEKHRTDSDAPLKTLFVLWLARVTVEQCFYALARAAGLKHYRLPDMDHLARISRQWYPCELGGGEGHLEVADVIDTVTRKKAHMVISVKPFGCLPSSGVSDGIQSLVTARYPEANFCPVETSGDGAVSVYSRVQMALFKARAKAQEEFEGALAAAGLSAREAARRASASRRWRSAVHYPRHVVAGTAANAVHELGWRAAAGIAMDGVAHPLRRSR
jgi:predicted nucleotide-binding protein (sugar kinase/HSP70/actin superfamily)